MAERFTYARILLGPLGDRRVSTADEYRRYAAECMALAERLTDPSDKSRLVQMAQAFLDLAERRDRLDPPSE